MYRFKISQKDGYNYALESGDKNKIHLDDTTGNNSIYGSKVCHGTLILINYLSIIESEKKISKQKNYSIHINFINAFLYDHEIIILKNLSAIKQNRNLNAIVKYSLKCNYNNWEFNKNEKFILSKSVDPQGHLNSLKYALNNLTRYVGMIKPGKDSIIKSININYDNDNKTKTFQIFSNQLNKKSPLIYNKILYKKFIIEFITAVRPSLKPNKSFISNHIKKKVADTLIPVLIIGASSGIGKEILKLYSNNKKIDIIATYSMNKINMVGKNTKKIYIDLTQDKHLDKIKKIINKYKKIRIYYFASPRITLSKNNKINIKRYKKFYIDYPSKILSSIRKDLEKLEFFYPSTIFINNKLDNDYVDIKKIAEKKLVKYSIGKVKINILRISQINTKQNLSFFNKKHPSFLELLEKNKDYQKNIFFE